VAARAASAGTRRRRADSEHGHGCGGVRGCGGARGGSSGACDCGGMWGGSGCGGAGLWWRAETRRGRLGQELWQAAAVDLIRKQDLNVRLKRLRSAFRAMTGRGGHMTERGGAASDYSPVSSWNDRTRPIRHDQTLIESSHILSRKLKRMTGRGGGDRDRTRWSATARPVQRPVIDPKEILRDDRMRW
jgi:hypothetical protein